VNFYYLIGEITKKNSRILKVTFQKLIILIFQDNNILASYVTLNLSISSFFLQSWQIEASFSLECFSLLQSFFCMILST
jgi:hypothetical protein